MRNAGPARHPAPAAPGGVGPAVRHGVGLPPGPHGPGAQEARARPVPAPPLHHRAGHGLPLHGLTSTGRQERRQPASRSRQGASVARLGAAVQRGHARSRLHRPDRRLLRRRQAPRRRVRPDRRTGPRPQPAEVAAISTTSPGLIAAVLVAGLPHRRPRAPGAVLMTGANWLQLAALAASSPPAPGCSAPTSPASSAVTTSGLGDRLFLPLERPIYRLCGVSPEREQRWTAYAALAARVQRGLGAGAVRHAAAAGLAAVQPDRCRRRAARRCRGTRRSASSPTRTGRTTPASTR